MPESPSMAPLKPAGKGRFDGLSSWQLLLSFLPLGLLFIGGAIGGAIGAVGLLTNVKLAKSALATPLKAVLMIAVVITANVLDLTIAALISVALHG